MPKGIYIHKRGWKHKTATKEKIGKANSISLKGKVRPEAVKKKIRDTIIRIGHTFPPVKYAEEHHGWKGNNVGYSGLHYWIESKRGRPTKCEHCGVENLRPRQYNWANKSHQYKRELTDWIRLCIRCHYKYDKNTNSKHYYAQNI